MKPITQAEQARWQREAVLALTEILNAHRGLPIIDWQLHGTLWLFGMIPLRDEDALASFEAWRDALGLGDETTLRDTVMDKHWATGAWTTGGGDRVKVMLHVTVPLPEDEVVR